MSKPRPQRVRYFLRLSFNGKNYHGWQLQKNAHSVQAELDQALSVFLKQKILTIGCGRTDTGVHAKTFFVHFDVTSEIRIEDHFVHHINCLLPSDIAVHELIEMKPDAHARFDALLRKYEYHLYQEKNPFLKDAAYFFPYELDIEKMNKACSLLKGHQDFSSFSKSRTQVKTNLCKIDSAIWKKEGSTIVFKIAADRFLRNMVRAIVGTMTEIGEGKIDEKEFQAIIEGRNRSRAGFSVPAHGLYLVDVKYPYL